jgi:hypothetical protein
MSAKVAKAGVHAARKSISRAFDGGQSRVRKVVDASGRRADRSLDKIEGIAMDVLDAIAKRGRGYAAKAKDRLYAVEGRILPRRRSSPIGPILAGVGAGVLVSLLLVPRSSEATGRRVSA